MEKKFSKSISIPAGIKILIAPVFAILISALVFVSAINVGYKQITSQLKKLKESSNAERVLEEKVNILSQIREGVLEQTNISVIAIPEKNPSPVIISLVKSAAQDNSVTLGRLELKGSSGAVKGISSGELSVSAKVENSSTEMASFIKSLIESIPLMRVSEINIGISGEEINFSFKGDYYWSDFPTQLPPINEPIKNLTADERSLLSNISYYIKPVFSTLEPQKEKDRSNPFN